MQSALVVSLAQDWAEAKGPGNATGKNQHAGNEESAREEHFPLTTTTDRATKSGAGYSTQRRADKLVKASPNLAKQVVDRTVKMDEAIKRIDKAKRTVSRAHGK